MKAHYYKAQALLELDKPKEAEEEAKKAYEMCKSGIDKRWEKSLSNAASLVLRSKKAVWEKREKSKARVQEELLDELVNGLENKRDEEIEDLLDPERQEELEYQKDLVDKKKKVHETWDPKIEELKRVWDLAEENGKKSRQVPDWVVDDITFGIMFDPVIVSD
jgi:STIP1 family protein 1